MAVLSVYNKVVIPDGFLTVSETEYKEQTGMLPAVGDKVFIFVCKEAPVKGEPVPEKNLNRIGASGQIISKDENGHLSIRVVGRVNLEGLSVRDGKYMDAQVSARPDIGDMSLKDQALHLDKVKKDLTDMVKKQQWSANYAAALSRVASLPEALSFAAEWLAVNSYEKYQMLAEDSIQKRFTLMEKALYESMEIAQLSMSGQNEVEQDYQKLYRENAIRKQMEYLQRQLDEMHPEEVTDVRRLEMKVQSLPLNPDARKEAEGILNRLKQEGSNSPEHGMLYNYLDFLTSLSWEKEEGKEIDLDEAQSILDSDHAGLEKVKRRILQQIAVMNLNHRQSGSILLFVGAPGTGKTSIGQSIARALGRKYVRVSLGGVRDEADIRGHRRTYIGAMPGRIMDGIKKSGVTNPVMVLDEVDKLGASYNGDPASALLEVLDPEQNSTFTDHYMNVPYDLSDVLFICTANSIDTIPEPLLNRMEVISFTGYSETEKFDIARKHLLPKAKAAAGISEDALDITDEALKSVISDYTREGGVRGLKKRLDSLCRSAAVELVRFHGEHFTVEADQLETMLDMSPLHHETVTVMPKPGVVTGLAWTPVGGEILFIETLFTKGSGQIIITGQLGDVMKESARLAVSLVKARFPEKVELFEKNDLHIHVPAGATPKDGPSAGITLTTAIASLVTGRPVSQTFAMTGEISLRGLVMPIGGLPEKLMAADRAGCKTVLIPAENLHDLKDVAPEVKNDLEIIPVRDIDSVLSKVGILDEPASMNQTA